MNRLISKINIIAIIALTMIAASCSNSESQDIKALLATVPTDASVVGVVNVSSILKEGGCKISGNKIKPSKELQNAIASINDPELKKVAQALVDGESGVRPTVCAIFSVGSQYFFTGLLDDTTAFKNFIETNSGEKFIKIDGAQVCKECVVVGDQFWITTESYLSDNEIAPRIMEFTKLSKQQSYLSGKYADSFIDMDDDARFTVDIAGTANNFRMGFKEKAMATTVINTLFKDATYSLITLDFDKNKIDLNTKFLDSKGNVAEFNLPTSKIDQSTIEKLGGSADTYVALAISGRLVDKIKEIVKSLSGLVPVAYSEFLTPIDGTAAIALSDENNDARAIITTNGKPSNELTSILATFVKVDKDGKYIFINKDVNTGDGITAAEAAKLMKGNFAAAVYASDKKIPVLKYYQLAIAPDGKGISMKVQVVTKEDNSVKALFKLASEIK